MRFLLSALVFGLACSSVGCSNGGDDGAGDGGADDVRYGHRPIDAATVDAAALACAEGETPSTTFPAPHPVMPLAFSSGGPVLKAPHFVPIVFSGDDQITDLGAFMTALGTSTYWTSIAAEYGVGSATAGNPIVVDETPPSSLDDGAVTDWLASKLDGAHPDFGAPDASAIYVIYYPAATTILAFGPSCLSFYGYHSETKIGGVTIAYAVIPRCTAPAPPRTVVTSHELFEAATDPYPESAPAYRSVSQTFQATTSEYEVGDLCEGKLTTPNDLGFPVQRIWSNAASSSGRDPCQPAAAIPYFRTVAAGPDLVPYDTTPTAGWVVSSGDARTIDLIAFSDRETGAPWSISVASSGSLFNALELSLCRTSARNGETIPLTISRPLASTGDNVITVTSTLTGVDLDGGNATTTWYLLVGDGADN